MRPRGHRFTASDRALQPSARPSPGRPHRPQGSAVPPSGRSPLSRAPGKDAPGPHLPRFPDPARRPTPRRRLGLGSGCAVWRCLARPRGTRRRARPPLLGAPHRVDGTVCAAGAWWRTSGVPHRLPVTHAAAESGADQFWGGRAQRSWACPRCGPLGCPANWTSGSLRSPKPLPAATAPPCPPRVAYRGPDFSTMSPTLVSVRCKKSLSSRRGVAVPSASPR